MGRYFKRISKTDLQVQFAAINDHDGDIGDVNPISNQFDINALIDVLKKDMKVSFDTENFESENGSCFGREGGLVGYHELDNGFGFWGFACGGDWETPLFWIAYWDGENMRGYIPSDGNPWNRTTKQAYGNDEAGDVLDAMKHGFCEPELDKDGKPMADEYGYVEMPQLEFDWAKIEADIKGRITEKK